MRKLIFIGALFLLFSCGNRNRGSNGENPQEKQLNISIFLDLSDRINPESAITARYPVHPPQWERDVEIVRTITEIFRRDMNNRTAWNARGRIRVFFSPVPPNPAINDIASQLNIDCSRMDNRERKVVFDTLTPLFVNSLTEIYTQTIQANQWIGSDIWRFFQNDVKDFCIANEDNYRNILVILTDGYIFHRQSVYNVQNRYSYLLQRNISRYRTRDYRERIQNDNFGLIATRNDLHNLEILVLGISAENNRHRIDEDILKFVLGNWFDEMNVARHQIFSTDLPVNTNIRIENFFNIR